MLDTFARISTAKENVLHMLSSSGGYQLPEETLIITLESWGLCLKSNVTV